MGYRGCKDRFYSPLLRQSTPIITPIGRSRKRKSIVTRLSFFRMMGIRDTKGGPAGPPLVLLAVIANLFVFVPFEFVSSKLAFFFFNKINFLLLGCSPKILDSFVITVTVQFHSLPLKNLPPIAACMRLSIIFWDSIP